MEHTKADYIDLRKVVAQLTSKKRVFFWVWGITFVVASVLIVLVPRTYTCSVKLAPEAESASAAGALGSIASSFGFDLGSMESADAIFPQLYPELFASNDFVVSLFDVQVKSLDGTINTTYYDYLDRHQKQTAWMIPVKWLTSKVGSLLSPSEDHVASTESSTSDQSVRSRAFMMSRRQTDVADMIRGHVVCGVDKLTNVVSITVTDQDPLICATIADSVRMKLQQFIIDYRTSKARVDVSHYEELLSQAKAEYDEAMRAYSAYTDSHKDVILQAFISERDRLEGDMSLKYQTYTAMKTQLEGAKAKLQEKVPAFTVLQGATVPIKPTGPKRMIFVIGMLILATIVCAGWVLRKEIHI